MEDVKQKILVVTEAYTLSDNEERNQDELTDLIANAVQNQGFDVDIEQFDVNYDYDINAQSVMNEIDKRSRELLIDDYLCVIAEGLSAWFWIRSKFCIPVICVNPITDVLEQLEDVCTESSYESFEEMDAERAYSSHDVQALCVLSDDALSDIIEYALETFSFSNTFTSEYELLTEEFWTDSHGIAKALKYAADNFCE